MVGQSACDVPWLSADLAREVLDRGEGRTCPGAQPPELSGNALMPVGLLLVREGGLLCLEFSNLFQELGASHLNSEIPCSVQTRIKVEGFPRKVNQGSKIGVG